MVNADPASLGGTGAPRNAPAPWVPYTRAGCDVGGVGLANIVLENNTSIVLRTTPAPTTLAAALRSATRTSRSTVSTGWPRARAIVLDNGHATNELATIALGRHGRGGGTGVTLTAALTKAHASAPRST